MLIIFSYRNITIYERIKLPIYEQCLFDACMYGGPIAVGLPINTERTQWKILIFTANAKILSSIEATAILTILWSRDQKVKHDILI